MHARIRVTAAATLLAFGLVGGDVAAPARASTDGPLEELLALNPGADAGEFSAQIAQTAAADGVSTDALIDRLLEEARAARSPGAPPRQLPTLGATTRDSLTGSIALGSGARKGDVFYSPVSFAGVTFGHSGIYYSTTTIVEAPGRGHRSWSAPASQTRVASGTVKQSVSTTTANRNAAANYAYNNLRNRLYNVNFAMNKTKNGAMNCSQLVWVAYYEAAGLDLDSNGGKGVYPSDIKNSRHTATYSTLGGIGNGGGTW